MRKRGANFRGKVLGARGWRAEMVRKAQESLRAETIAQALLSSRHGERLDRDQIVKLAVGARSALEEVRVGRGAEGGVGWVVNAANLAVLLCEIGLGQDQIDVARSAQDALVRMINRYAELGRWVLDGQGYTACVAMLDLHEGQLESEDLTDAMLMRALVECERRQREGQVLECAEV